MTASRAGRRVRARAEMTESGVWNVEMKKDVRAASLGGGVLGVFEESRMYERARVRATPKIR